MLPRYSSHISICHNLPKEKTVTIWKTFKEVDLEALFFKSKKFPDP